MGTETEIRPTTTAPSPPRGGTQLLLVLALLVAAPVGAEYIQAYDDSTGRPLALLAGLLIFVPLYGAPAVLLRELACRFGVGWPGILALATGFGVLQAGVIDQAMFNTSYRDLDFWDAMIQPTWLEPFGLSANAAIVFVIGHAVWSFGIPIALIQGVNPRLARRPWLGWKGLAVVTLLYLAAATLLIVETGRTEGGYASIGQLAGALAVTALLALYAFTVGRRPRALPRRARPVPPRLVIVVVTFVLAFGFNLQPPTWTGTVVMVGLGLATVVGVAYLSGSVNWNGRHVAALATGALVARVGVGFLADPIGDGTAAQQLGHNLFFLTVTLVLGWWTMTRRPEAVESR